MKWKKDKGAAAATEPQNGDEALFAALEKNKKRKRSKRIRILAIVAVLLVGGGFLGTRLLQRQVRTQFAKDTKEVLNAKATRGTISTLVSGSGMLSNVDTETVSVPSGVEVTEILVDYGDTVKEGDILATVDMSTVRSAMTDLKATIEDLDKQIASAKSDTVSGYIASKVAGRIKAVYAEKDDLVEDVMVKHGSLALISLDGYMEANIEAEGLSKGDSVTVIREDGSSVSGLVESVIASRATVLVSDDGPRLDETVTVCALDGTTLGSAQLTIHNSMSVTGYAGTVNAVNIKENQKINSYATLFTLSNTSTTACYNALLRSRSEYEETLWELLALQRNNALVAPISGSIYSVADLDEDTDEEILDIVTISPDKQMEATINVSESNILSLELGQKADVTVSSVGDEVLEGVVTEIDKTYSSGYYTATITLDKVTGMIPGMTASVDIKIEGVENAILIPYDALHQTSSGYYVYTSYNTETKEYGGRVDVVPGLSNSSKVEIKSGLNEGDTVYYTETETFTFNFGGMGGGMPGGMGSSSRPSGMPSGMGSSSRPSGMPSGMSGSRPSGFGG